MLCQFSVKNFQCFKEQITFDMQATSISEHADSLLVDKDGEAFLPIGVIYGPNGSGKSTLLKALFALRARIRKPICSISNNDNNCQQNMETMKIETFAFSKESLNASTDYEVFFRTDTAEYQYCISILKDKIVYESLDRKMLTGFRYSNIFERNGKNDIKLKGSLKKYDVSGISDTLTLISYFGITHKKNAVIKDVVNWFHEGIKIINYGSPGRESEVLVADDAEIKPLVEAMIEEMDMGISSYRINKRKAPEDAIEVFTIHNVNGVKHELKLQQESSGTIKIFSILPYVADCLLNGGTLVVDELDSKVHPLLLGYIIKLFTDPKKNKKKAQLIFTSHDLSTMNSKTFRRDEIWFVAQNAKQEASLYSLVEFKKNDGKAPRVLDNYSKQYIEGKYGADPYLRRIIDWEEING